MNIHEYQAKELLRHYGVAVPRGGVAFSVEEACQVASSLAQGTAHSAYVVKAQIHAGGRGKAGGVTLVKDVAGVATEARRMLGLNLVTHQTGPEGQKVSRIYVEEGCAIARELYLSLVIDRSTGRVTVMASTAGGVDIENVAATTPEKIITLAIDPATGVQPFHGRRIADGLGLTGTLVAAMVGFIAKLYQAFTALDASIVEINPLVITQSGGLLALDAKMNFDDNALYRQRGVLALRDESEENPAEMEASKHQLNYVKLDGTIGCMVNGAGLAMATMDIIKLYGGTPANFLDVGGGATKERVAAAFKIILSDPHVKAILVNIFGGITLCDSIAHGIVAAAKQVALTVPLVVRLEGTNVAQGKKVLAESGLPIITADNLADAGRKVVATLHKDAA